MDVYPETIRALPADAKLLLVERIWDDLAAQKGEIPLPDWALAEAKRRRDAMFADPTLGITDEEVWRRIDEARNG